MSTTRGVAITAVGNAIPPAVMLVTQILLANSLGVVDRGAVAAATAPLMLAVALLTLGLPDALTHFVARAGGVRLTRQFLVCMVALGVSGSVGMCVIAFLARPLSAGSEQLAGLITIASAALVPGLATAALRGVAYGAQQWWLIMIERSLSASLQLFAVGGLFLADSLRPATATLAIVATTFAGSVVYVLAPRWRAAIRGYRISPQRSPSLHGIASYAWKVWVGSTAGVVISRLDQVLMTPLAGIEQLGIYVVAVNVSSVALLFNSAVAQVMFAVESGSPSITRIGRAARVTTLATTFVGITLAVASPWMVPLLFGGEFAPAAPIVAVLLLSIVLGVPGSVAGAALSARGRPGLRSLALTIATVLYIIAMFLLVPRFGAMGAALAMLVGTTAPYLCIFWLHRHYGVPLYEFYRFRWTDLDIVRCSRFSRRT